MQPLATVYLFVLPICYEIGRESNRVQVLQAKRILALTVLTSLTVSTRPRRSEIKKIPVVDMVVCEYPINAHQVTLMRPATRVITEVAEEEEDLEGAVQYESGELCQLHDPKRN
jgi:hypothetical protein